MPSFDYWKPEVKSWEKVELTEIRLLVPNKKMIFLKEERIEKDFPHYHTHWVEKLDYHPFLP